MCPNPRVDLIFVFWNIVDLPLCRPFVLTTIALFQFLCICVSFSIFHLRSRSFSHIVVLMEGNGISCICIELIPSIGSGCFCFSFLEYRRFRFCVHAHTRIQHALHGLIQGLIDRRVLLMLFVLGFEKEEKKKKKRAQGWAWRNNGIRIIKVLWNYVYEDI